MKIIETPILVENRKFKRRSWNEIGKHCRKISSEYWNFSRSRSKYGGRFENHRNSNFGRKRKFKENVSERRKILSEYWTFFSRFRSFTVDVLIIEIPIWTKTENSKENLEIGKCVEKSYQNAGLELENPEREWKKKGQILLLLHQTPTIHPDSIVTS